MAKCPEEVVFEGWLTKSPPTKRIWRARWRRRWFLLTHSGDIPGQYVLTYYTDRNRRKLKGVIDLDRCEQVDLGLKLEDRHLKFDHVFDIKTPHRTYYLAADTEEEMKSWVTCICRVCGLKSTNEEDEDLGIPMNTPDIEITEVVSAEEKGHSIVESPPISPASTSPYIPISECITGKSPVYDSDDFKRLYEYNRRHSNRYTAHNNDTYESHSQNAYVNFANSPERNYVNDLQDPRFYDNPRSLAPQKPTTVEQSSPLLSPTDSDNVFNEENSTALDAESSIRRQSHRSESSVDVEMTSEQQFIKPVNTVPPPRPPKPPHITPPPCYLNLTPAPITQSKESVDKTKVGGLQLDEMYDFPRSHNVESDQTKGRHCYNNAAPVKCAEGTIFRYDVSPKPTTTSVFRYDLASLQDMEPSSPAHSHTSSTPAYSNLPSPMFTDTQMMPPPTVNRELKPKRKLSDAHSTSSNTEPPSPRNVVAAPSIDRKLKPPTPLQEGSTRKSFHSSEEEAPRRIRAAPSPTPPGLGDSLYQNEEEMYQYINKKMQYLDLDLEGLAASEGEAKTSTKPTPDTVYKKVDFVKTEAFNITRNNLEKERQEPVTTFVKK